MCVRHAAGVVTAVLLALAVPAAAVPPPVPVPAPGCAVSSDGRVLLLRAEDNAEDSIGGHDGTLFGATATYAPGVAGQAFSIPGDADHVEIANAPEFAITGDLTLEGWVQLADTNFGTGGPNGVGGDRVIVWNSNASETPVFALWIEGDGTTALAAPLRFFATPATVDPAFVDSQPLAWLSGTWYHVAVTRTAGVVSFYRDGQPVGTATLAAPHDPDGNLPLGIGAAPIAGSVFNPIKGAIDEAAVWRRALGASEVAALNAAGTGGCGPPAYPVDNLLAARDGNAEAGRSATDTAATVPPPPGYWGAGGAISQLRYAAGATSVGGLPGDDIATSIGGGSAFFAGGPTTSPTSVLTSQDIDLGWARDVIDAGLLEATMSAALGGRGSEADSAMVTFEYRNAGGVVSTTQLGPVTDVDRAGQTTLLARSAIADVPATTTFVRVTVTFLGAGSGYADGYVDNVGIALVRKPGQVPTPTPTPTVTVTAGPTIQPSHPPVPLRVDPTRVTATVTPKRDRVRPYTFTTSGRLVVPAGVDPVTACTGTVRTRFKRRTTTIKSHTVSLRPDCTYHSRTTGFRSSLSAGSLSVTAHFNGNAALFPRTSLTKIVRVG
ncbi:MAG: hypothetical protein QOI80_1536 [Solirubrobacteraceae bacterium]|nr:hypothetical protein [Solirubrobacteraceae bacterium]